MKRPTLRFLLAAAMLTAVAATSPGLAAAMAPGVYTGKTPRRGDRNMDIWLQLLPGGRAAKWRVDVHGPCSPSRYAFGWSIGFDTGPGYHLLKVRAGHFAISKHGVIAKRDPSMQGQDAYHYTLTGHAVRGGLAGTFHWHEHSTIVNPPTTCDSTVLHWHANKTQAVFP
jgi:hypothetical protein